MQTLRVALAQIGPKLGDLTANLELHLERLERGRSEGADLVVFPELSLTGYLLKDQTPDVARTLDSPDLAVLLAATREIDALIGMVEEAEGHRYYNAAVYLSGGKVAHVHRKLHLPTYGMFDEGRDFAAGHRLRTADRPFARIGILICEDAWHSPNAWLLAQDGAEILFVLGSGPTRGARQETGITSVPVWRDLLKTTAQFQTAQVIYVNRVGYEDGLNFGGGSIAIDPFGREIGSLPALEEGWMVVELEGEVLRRARTAYPLLRDSRIERFGLPEPD